jgi:hypothetical protein
LQEALQAGARIFQRRLQDEQRASNPQAAPSGIRTGQYSYLIFGFL